MEGLCPAGEVTPKALKGPSALLWHLEYGRRPLGELPQWPIPPSTGAQAAAKWAGALAPTPGLNGCAESSVQTRGLGRKVSFRSLGTEVPLPAPAFRTPGLVHPASSSHGCW
jgi:hypothetical protein